MELCYVAIGGLLSTCHLAALVLWEVCQQCVATIVSLLLGALRLVDPLPLIIALPEASKVPARIGSIPIPVLCYSSSSPRLFPLLPPRLTVVLDLDETIVCAFKPSKVPPALHGNGTFSVSVKNAGPLVIYRRPGLNEFLLRLSSFAEIVVFTAGVQAYAGPVLDALDPERRFFSGRLYRESVSRMRGHNNVNNVKDLARLGRDLARIVLVDDNAWSFLLQPANGIPALPFLGSSQDRHLLGVLLPLLEALSRAPDVRPVLQSQFDMAGWFGRRGVCMYERPDHTLTAAATLTH